MKRRPTRFLVINEERIKQMRTDVIKEAIEALSYVIDENRDLKSPAYNVAALHRAITLLCLLSSAATSEQNIVSAILRHRAAQLTSIADDLVKLARHHACARERNEPCDCGLDLYRAELADLRVDE